MTQRDRNCLYSIGDRSLPISDRYDQRGGTTDLPPATARPHHRCVDDTALAARPRTRAVQDRGAERPYLAPFLRYSKILVENR